MPLSLVADYLSATLGTYLKWWLRHQPSYSPERMDEMFQQMVMPGVWATLEKDDCGEFARVVDGGQRR